MRLRIRPAYRSQFVIKGVRRQRPPVFATLLAEIDGPDPERRRKAAREVRAAFTEASACIARATSWVQIPHGRFK